MIYREQWIWVLPVVILFLHIWRALSQVQASPAVYDEKLAKEYIHFNAASVCSDERLQTWSCGEQCDATRPFILESSVELLGPTPSHLHGFVVQASSGLKQCIVVVAGTSFYDFRNIWVDLQLWTTAWPSWSSGSGSCSQSNWCPGCRVHSGFAVAYAEMRDHLFAALSKLDCESVVLTGHSLGGALVTLAAFELLACHNKTHHVESVWTYGMPRVGNEEFVRNYMKLAVEQHGEPPMWRLVNQVDLIPQVPPTFLGYHHIPWEVRYTNESQHVICKAQPATSSEDPACVYGGGSMKYHHDYLGVKGTDENKASTDCISEEEMRRKQEGFQQSLIWLILCSILIFGVCCTCCCTCCFACCPGACSRREEVETSSECSDGQDCDSEKDLLPR